MSTPRIVALEWGRIETEGGLVFKDAKIHPDGACEWDWRETGMRHVPGIQPADAQELLDHGAEVVVLTRGMELVLLVPDATVRWLEERGVEVVVAETREAARRFNELVAQGRGVAGLFHSTC